MDKLVFQIEKKPDEGSGDLFDRIANLPILQLLNPKRRSRPSTSSRSIKNLYSKSYCTSHQSDNYNGNSFPHVHRAQHKTKPQVSFPLI